MCGIGSCQVPMAIGSANHPEASGQFPLAKLVAERRREMGLTLAEVARLMDKAASAEEVGGPGANRRPPGAPSPARVVIATLPDSEHAWLAGGTGATSTARPAWGTGHEEGLILEAAARQPRDNEYVNRRQLLIDLGVLGL